jgi:nucleotide-binding universal stress UspA family protein
MKPSGRTNKKLITLLVPTDFSAAAKNAAHYAVRLAAQINARVALLSVIEMDTTETVLSNWRKLELQMKKAAMRDLEKLRSDLISGVKTADVVVDVTEGIPKEEAIAAYARDKQVDLIVMGTKGASGLKKILHGSNTSQVMEVSPVPVIGVPAKAVFSGMKKMVYATDMKNVLEETRRMARIAEPFGASVLVLHCVPMGSTRRQDRNIEPELINKAQYGAIAFHQIQSDDVSTAIGQFMKTTGADLLVMFTHQRSFFEKLFGKSVTRSIAFQSRVPLLAFNRPAK